MTSMFTLLAAICILFFGILSFLAPYFIWRIREDILTIKKIIEKELK